LFFSHRGPLFVSHRGQRESSERKTKHFHSRVGKLYLELTIRYLCLQAHELVRPLAICDSVPLIIDIGAVPCARRLAVDLDREPHWLRSRWRAHYEIHVAGVEAIREPTIRLVQHGASSFHRPSAGESPLIERQARNGVGTRRIL
jgi:hypothetical protein